MNNPLQIQTSEIQNFDHEPIHFSMCIRALMAANFNQKIFAIYERNMLFYWFDSG